MKLTTPNDRWSFTVFGTNLTDTGYCISMVAPPGGTSNMYKLDHGDGTTIMHCNLGEPRSYDVRVGVNF